MCNELFVEIIQVKGILEVYFLFNLNDEWVDFEIYFYKIVICILSELDGFYVCQVLVCGFVFEEQEGFNFFCFGFIGLIDSYNVGGIFEEVNYVGKVGVCDGLLQK